MAPPSTPGCWDRITSRVAKAKKRAALRPPSLETSGRAYGPYSVSPNVTLMNTPICSRVTGWVGQ